MKHLLYLLTFLVLLISCSTTQSTQSSKTQTNTDLPEGAVRIANDELEYEIIIIDIGFENYLITAKPMSYYSETYLESKNKFYVSTWNYRASNLIKYDSKIYENIIDYDYNIHYGLEVNYKLYNYFKFVEERYNQKF
jgi:hypothetical protein